MSEVEIFFKDKLILILSFQLVSTGAQLTCIIIKL